MTKKTQSSDSAPMPQSAVSGTGAAITGVEIIDGKTSSMPAKPQAPAVKDTSDVPSAGNPAEAEKVPESVKTQGAKPTAPRSAGKVQKSSAKNLKVTSGKSAKRKPASSAGAKIKVSKTPKVMEIKMTANKAQMDKLAKEAQDLSRDNIEAFVKSGSIWAKGYEDIVRETISFAQKTAEKQSAYMKEAMSCKTINEFADVQNKIAKANFEEFVAGATKISEMGAKVLSESAQPLNDQASKAIKKANEAMAA